MVHRTLKSIFFAALIIGLSACGGNDGAQQTGSTDQQTGSTDQPANSGAGSTTNEQNATLIEIGPVGNEMRFDRTEFTVQPGQQVRIVFRNTATSPAMKHNVVVLDSRDAIDRVGTAAIQAGEANEYVPDDQSIIAYTPLSDPGETVEVTFTAPSEPGEYPYICTFPGHYMLMQGVMTVQTGASS